ncbi:transposase [Streptantibioticus silvisoli]|uniref:Mutator family transposase n=1 Tax=Streptantibioticus silvisoli TaxID=2705255 RepID=A0ABT6VVJ3_9ACTN|nr:transposase [Streptantibioticus silvisoli]MDI5962505.1 transposase [Streptantibioticus silvisoli]
MRDRGLRPPLPIVSDGAKGLIGAVEYVFSHALRQRCTIHKMCNVPAKVSKDDQETVRAEFWRIFDIADPDIRPGQELVGTVQRRIDSFVATWEAKYPAAMKAMATDRASRTTHLRFPVEHHKRIRHSNFIERTFGETRRRAKVIGRFPSEKTCTSLVRAVLDRASRGWRGFTMTPAGLRCLHDLRRALLEPPTMIRENTNEIAETLTNAA